MDELDPVEAPDTIQPEVAAVLAEMLDGVWEPYTEADDESAESVKPEEIH